MAARWQHWLEPDSHVCLLQISAARTCSLHLPPAPFWSKSCDWVYYPLPGLNQEALSRTVSVMSGLHTLLMLFPR